ncbi:hypothetical protein HY630_00260 [Candidatus Uhrbacteria bacterium]|nr:hypothetical protein [Candidatus Uhrbacteria bacterium]
MSAGHRRWFWALMCLGLAIIATGWVITIRGFLATVPQITSSIEQGAARAVEEVREAQLDPSQGIDEASRAFEALKAGYDAEKEKQQEATSDNETTYEQEDTTP